MSYTYKGFQITCDSYGWQAKRGSITFYSDTDKDIESLIDDYYASKL